MKTKVKIFTLYFITFFTFSVFLKIVLHNNKKPINNTNAYRVFGIIPLRETLTIPPSSFLVWYFISKKMLERNGERLVVYKAFYESLLASLITGFIIHKLFGIKTKLGNIIGLTKKPDGTGIAPWSNYKSQD